VSDILPTREVPPDILIDDSYAFALGERRFKIIWTPGGEIRSAVIVWFDPARGTTELYGVPPAAVAPAIAGLAGGSNLWERMWIAAEFREAES